MRFSCSFVSLKTLGQPSDVTELDCAYYVDIYQKNERNRNLTSFTAMFGVYLETNEHVNPRRVRWPIVGVLGPAS